MTVAILCGIIGGVLGGFGKLSLIALMMSLLAVFVYFFVGKGILFNLFLFSSVGLVIIEGIISRKKIKHKNGRENYQAK